MELFIIIVNLSFVTYLFILQMINLILTSTDTQSTTFHISSLSEDWLHETSIIPTLFSLKCLCQVRKVNGHILVFGIWILPVSIIFFDWTLELFSYDNNIVKPYQSSQCEKSQENCYIIQQWLYLANISLMHRAQILQYMHIFIKSI